MKIKLIVAPYHFYDAFMPPLGVGIVSAALKKNGIEHDIDDLYVKLYHAVIKGRINTCVFLDPDRVRTYIYGVPCGEIDDEVEKIMAFTDFSGYDYVCFSGHYPPLNTIDGQMIVACLMRKIKEKYDVSIVTNFDLLSYPDSELIDFKTEDIDRFIDFLKVKNKIDPEIPKVFLRPNFKGLPLRLYKYDRNTVIAECLPKTFRLSDLSGYDAIAGSLPLLLPYSFVEGCQNNCIFCECSENPGFKIKDLDEVVNDLQFLTRTYKTKNYFFLNSNINPTKQVVRDLTDTMFKKKLKIKFADCATFRNLDDEILLRLRDAGAVRLVIGLETAGPQLQRFVGKVIDLDHASHVLKRCYEYGIWVDITLLIGLPSETSRDVIATMEFIRDHYLYIRGINLNRFVLKWQSLLKKNSEKYNLVNLQPDPDYGYSYDEAGGMKWDMKKKLMEYRYVRMLGCMDPNKVDYYRAVQFEFLVNSTFKDPKSWNKYLDNHFFTDTTWKRKIEDFIKEMKEGADIAKARKFSLISHGNN